MQTIRHFDFNSPWPLFLSRYAALDFMTRRLSRESANTAVASLSSSGLIEPHWTHESSSTSIAWMYLSMVCLSEEMISRQGTSRSNCLSSWRVSQRCCQIRALPCRGRPWSSGRNSSRPCSTGPVSSQTRYPGCHRSQSRSG